MNIEEGNKLIAEFMGCKSSKNKVTCKGVKYTFPYNKNESKHVTHLAYHLSWDWLMPVLEKITDINEMSPTIQIGIITSIPTSDHEKEFNIECFDTGDTIVNTWRACVNFIKYNNAKDISSLQP